LNNTCVLIVSEERKKSFKLGYLIPIFSIISVVVIYFSLKFLEERKFQKLKEKWSKRKEI